jgi:RNA polymerase sigma-70 factor (ECF subfamily)
VSDWDRIVREHGPLAFATAKRILGHVADAEDVVQDALIEAHRTAQSRPIRHWPGFVRRLATCRALDRLRQRRNVVSLSGLSLRDAGHGPPEAAMAKELADRLRQALAQLPGREGEVFCLRYFEDLSYQQIAEILDVQPGAVAQALHKARAKLEALLNEVVKGA